MIRTRFLTPVAAALLLAAGALAQPSGSEATTSAPAEQPDGADTDKNPDADARDRAPASVDKSPSDYRASERISEDRPVSFPVDI